MDISFYYVYCSKYNYFSVASASSISSLDQVVKRSQTAVGVADYYKEGRTKGVAASSTVGLRIVATSAHGKLNRLCKIQGDMYYMSPPVW